MFNSNMNPKPSTLKPNPNSHPSRKLCKYTAEQLKMNMWQFVADRLFEFFAVLCSGRYPELAGLGVSSRQSEAQACRTSP